MNPLATMKRLVGNSETSVAKLKDIREGVDHQTTIVNNKFNELIRMQREMLDRQRYGESGIADEHLVKRPLDERVEYMLARIEALFPSEQEAAKLFAGLTKQMARDHHHSYFFGDRLLTFDKTLAFMNDPKFAKAYKAIHGLHTYNQYDTDHSIDWRLNTLVWAARRGAALPGDFVECGVFKGHMAWVVSQCVNLEEHKKDFYLYDTYEGFDSRYSSEQDFPDSPGTFAKNDKEFREPGIYESVVARFKDQPRAKVIKGVIPDIFDKVEPKQISFLHVDLNSAAPERATFERFWDRISPGAAIVLDDYGWYIHRPQHDSANAFFNARGYQVMELPTGQGLVIK